MGRLLLHLYTSRHTYNFAIINIYLRRWDAMLLNNITGVSWYRDDTALGRGEPGLAHSFIAAVATSFNHWKGEIDPVALMGASGFAFRIIVNPTFCPSVFSVFDWQKILPETLEQIGYKAIHISRLWHEGNKEAERRQLAHNVIIEAIEKNIPPIVWDIHEAKWGVIVGFDDENKAYHCLGYPGKAVTLDYDKLGQNEIKILSVIIPDRKSSRKESKINRQAIETAVDHATQKEWMERPNYQDGLPAFDMWSSSFEKWAMIERAGKGENISKDIPRFAFRYAEIYYSARCYARDYMNSIAGDNSYLVEAGQHYEHVAKNLKPIYEHFLNEIPVSAADLKIFAELIRRAKFEEEKAITALEKYLV